MKLKRTIFFVPLALIAIASLALSSTSTLAQRPQPTASPKPPLPPGAPHGGHYDRGDEGSNLWQSRQESHASTAMSISPQAAGGPDDFGYTWDDSVALNWIDASGGTDTGLADNCNSQTSIPIGFSFKYYENTYSNAIIDFNGFVTFTSGYDCYSEGNVPYISTPNNVIAPYWGYFQNGSGHVRYLQGGSAPNRYLVIEWYQMTDGDSAASYTFETILYENGDILFQYQTMDYSSGDWSCAGTGIEDSTGLDGLHYQFCNQISSNKAVRFYRPAPSARLKIFPLYYGKFTHAGETVAFQVPIRNMGDLGSDIYDLFPSSTWPVSFYAADGTTLLTDTDSDGAVDTGSLAQGGTFTVTVKVQTSGGGSLGDDNTATVTARSSLNPSKSKIVTLNTAIPAPFAQVYSDDADGALSLYLAQPGAQVVKKVTSNWHYGFDMAVAEMPSSFAYFWTHGRCLDIICNVYGDEIEYTLLDRYGQTERGISKLTDHTGAIMSTYDFAPAVAVAPNGRIGVLWSREVYNSSSGQYNYNIFFAILDSSGNLAYSPVNLTNNTNWGSWGGGQNITALSNPRITATGDNRFVLGWTWESLEAPSGSCTNSCWLYDIYFAVRDTNGGAVKEVTKFTNGVTGGDEYFYPTLAALSGNRALLAYNGPNGILYAVLDSSGGTVKDATATGGGGWLPDAVQLSNGNIVIASASNTINFVVLNSATYNVTAGPNTLVNPAAINGSAYVSVAADAADHAVLTWMDRSYAIRANLYYALVDGNGGVLTAPMIFRTAEPSPFGDSPYIETSYEGYGNTSYSWTSPAEVDLNISSHAWVGVSPGGLASIPIQYQNIGASPAASVTITATLDMSLTYVSDTSGVTPMMNGDTLTWTLPGMDFLDTGEFLLNVSVPSSEFGTRYSLELGISSAGMDANPADNVFDLDVMIARQVFLPLSQRNSP